MSVLGQTLPMPTAQFGQRQDLTPYQYYPGTQGYGPIQAPFSNHQDALYEMSGFSNVPWPSQNQHPQPSLPDQQMTASRSRGPSPSFKGPSRTPIMRSPRRSNAQTAVQSSVRAEEALMYATESSLQRQVASQPAYAQSYEGSMAAVQPIYSQPRNQNVQQNMYEYSQLSYPQPSTEPLAFLSRQDGDSFAGPHGSSRGIQPGGILGSLMQENQSTSGPESLPSISPPVSTSTTRQSGTSQQMLLPTEPVRFLTPRPKPQCWEHGCNGRQFSTFSNLLRHQREKAGTASKSVCPHCGLEFTRTTARNGHLTGGKCKGRPSDRRRSGEIDDSASRAHEFNENASVTGK